MQTEKRQRRALRAGTALAMLVIIASLLTAGCKVMKADEAFDEGMAEDAAGQNAAEGQEGMAEGTEEGKKDDVISNIVGRVVMAPECSKASISLLEIDGRKELCTYGKTLTVGLLNDGETALKGIDLYTTGKESGEIMTTIRSAIGIGSSARQIVMYDGSSLGKLEKVRIVPILKLENGKEAVCSEKAIADDDIGVCG